MDTVFRGVFVYVFLLVLFRIAGKRTLGQISTFDLVLTLIVSEAIQQAMVDSDNSLTGAALLVVTLVGMNVVVSLLKQRFPRFERVLEDAPIVIIEDGRIHRGRMDKERVDEQDVLSAARQLQGLATLKDVRYAVVEKDGHVTIVPKKN
ncbi:MAG: DUF421 domain-containing protein [Acidobacteria bacterium]|nr:MAG: DUF421 domain-containing protein [Acidobacteriota bacterium]